MGVIDKVTDKVSALLPSRGSRRDAGNELPSVGAEVLALRDNLDGWLQRFFEEPWGLPAVGGFQLVPSTSVQETDNELIVTVEVPGLTADDLDLTVTPEAVIVRGAKQEEVEDARKDLYVSERRYGNFVRTIPLPRGLDLDRVEARVDRGVLTVRFPKREPRREGRRIPIQP